MGQGDLIGALLFKGNDKVTRRRGDKGKYDWSMDFQVEQRKRKEKKKEEKKYGQVDTGRKKTLRLGVFARVFYDEPEWDKGTRRRGDKGKKAGKRSGGRAKPRTAVANIGRIRRGREKEK